MAAAPRSLAPYESVLAFFGAELRHWREIRGLSQAALAAEIFVSNHLIGKIETAERWPTGRIATLCDQALGANGALIRLQRLVAAQRATHAEQLVLSEHAVRTIAEQIAVAVAQRA